jgi:hypothetical protein
MNYRQKQEEDTVVLSQLYSKLAASLSQSGVVGNNPSSLLSIQIPGITVETGLDPDDIKTQYYISNFLNFTLECNYVSTVKAGSVSDVYKLILDGKEIAITELTPLEQKELKDAENFLLVNGEPTKEFTAYKLYAMNFYCAKDDLETAESTEKNGGEKVPENVKTNYKNAIDEWAAKGYKDEVEEALDVIEQLQAKERYVYWNNLNKRYQEHTKELDNGSTFQYNTSIPEYKDWFKPELWTPFIFDDNDYDNQSRSGGLGMISRFCCCQHSKILPIEHLNPKGSSSFDGVSPIPKPSVGYNSRHSPNNMFASWNENSPETETYFKNSVEEFKFSCSFKRINIIRPWMESNVFYSRMWRWSPMSIGYGIEISTGGTVAGNNPATGVMPVLPTTALLAKDIKFTSTDSELIKWLENEFAQGKQVRFGPFRLNKGEKVLNGSKETYSITSTSAPQIFGYISIIFPECPNPDLSLKWPN